MVLLIYNFQDAKQAELGFRILLTDSEREVRFERRMMG